MLDDGAPPAVAFLTIAEAATVERCCERTIRSGDRQRRAARREGG
jgi:hypothetical protein